MNKSLLQLTLAIIKPNIIKQPLALNGIRSLIIENNFKIVRWKRSQLSLLEAENFYEEHRNKFFFNRLTTFMSSGPSEFYILAKMNAIEDWRKIMGPTKVYKAQFEAPNTIRGLYGHSDTRNATHGSDSPETARREINLFFPNFNLEDWYRNEELFFRQNKVKFVEGKFLHVLDIK